MKYLFIINWKRGINKIGRTMHTSHPRALWRWINLENRNIVSVSVWNSARTKHFGNYSAKGKKLRK